MKRCFCVCACMLLWSAAAGADVWLENEKLKVRFSDQGDLISAEVCFPSCLQEPSRRQQIGDSESPLLDFDDRSDSWRISRRQSAAGVEVRFDLEGRHSSRVYTLNGQSYRVNLALDGDQPDLTANSGRYFRPAPAAGFGRFLERIRYTAISPDSVVSSHLTDPKFVSVSHAPGDWFGFRNRYWAAMLHSDQPQEANYQFGAEVLDAAISVPATGQWLMYFGPVEPRILADTDPALKGMMYAGLWFWLRWICFALFFLLLWIQQLIPVWGLAIIALSVVVKFLMWPLNRVADYLQHQVHDTQARLEPRLEDIKQNYKGEQQAQRVLALYKAEGVSPMYALKSLFGVAVLIPIFIGAFDMLAENIHLSAESFLWVKDLARPDAVAAMPFGLPFFGSDLNLLPFIMTGLSVVTSALHQPPAMTPGMHRRQVRNLIIMALAFFILFYTFPAGMVLYWTTNNLISVIKDLWKRWHNPAPAN